MRNLIWTALFTCVCVFAGTADAQESEATQQANAAVANDADGHEGDNNAGGDGPKNDADHDDHSNDDTTDDSDDHGASAHGGDHGDGHSGGGHTVEKPEPDARQGLFYIGLALVVLTTIVFTSLKIESFVGSIAIYVSLGVATCLFVYNVAGSIGLHVLDEVFKVDYVQFITIPLATVLIASLGLFEIRVKDNAKLGWFLFLVCPIVGNFATTWSLVPIGLSLMPVLRERYPDKWLRVMIGMCIFSMNMLALATLAADPPQAYWAVKAALLGKPLGFFFPFKQFWPYLIVTWALYAITLKRFGIEFGSLKNLARVLPKSWFKFTLGVVIAVCVGYSVSELVGYQITWFLGTVCTIAAVMSVFFGHEARHHTLHWGLETVTIFIAFFSVVALAHLGLHYLDIPNQGMIVAVIGLTLGADNAAAFAAAYPQFAQLPEQYQVWYNLLPSVTCGGLSPLGNGPQIALFLIVFVGLKGTTAKEVFITWFKEAMAFGPYLLIWILGPTCLIEMGYTPTVAVQFFIGLVAIVAALQFMDITRLFRSHIDDEGDSADALPTA